MVFKVKTMSSNGRFKAVLFDLEDTLVKTAEPAEVFKRILEVYGVRVSFSDIGKAHRKSQKQFDVEEMAEKGLDYWIEWNVKILQRVGIKENREFLARKIDELWFEYAGLEVYSDVVETLTKLRARNVRMGAVTNGFQRDFQKIMRQLELTSFFDIVVGIDACMKAKPNREIFLYAIKKLRVRPGETIFVGDSVKLDYNGAERAGLKPLLINRNGKIPIGVEAITSLPEVLRNIG